MYTLLSDVQRNANDLRQDVRATLLERLHHDQPVSGQYGSVQRTSRRNRTLKADDEVLERLDAEGIDRERITSVDSSKVDEALEVTNIAESEVYEITESEYVRKADVDEAEKESRLQGLKDQLAATDTTESEELRSEIEALETRIDELTSFQPGSEYTEQDWSRGFSSFRGGASGLKSCGTGGPADRPNGPAVREERARGSDAQSEARRESAGEEADTIFRNYYFVPYLTTNQCCASTSGA